METTFCLECHEAAVLGHTDQFGHSFCEDGWVPEGENVPCTLHAELARDRNTARCTVWAGFFCGSGCLGERVVHCLERSGFTFVRNVFDSGDVPSQVWERFNPTPGQRRLSAWVNDEVS